MRRIAPCARVLHAVVPAAVIALTAASHAQQTLGNLNGTVMDTTGAAIAGAQVQLNGDVNGVKLTTTSKKDGTYQFENLPVGSYTLLFMQQGFESERVPAIPIEENRTGTINSRLRAGSTSTTVDVIEQPLLNQTDATNGYVLNAEQIQTIPLATQSFTQAAILAPGVNTELVGGIGTNAGLGNSPIWANGQRDTSNGFAVNGVDVTNLFNGKSSSEDNSQRYAFNIGRGAATGGQSQTNTPLPDRPAMGWRRPLRSLSRSCA